MRRAWRLGATLAAAALPAALLGPGFVACGGTVIGGASCISVCTNVGPCLGTTGPGGSNVDSCIAGCAQAQAQCEASGEGIAFENVLECLGSQSCPGESTMDIDQACGPVLQAARCSTPIMPGGDGGLFDVPPISFDASEGAVESSVDGAFEGGDGGGDGGDGAAFDGSADAPKESGDASFEAGGDAADARSEASDAAHGG